MLRTTLIAALLAFLSAASPAQNLTDTRTITVHGDATVYAVPDEAVIRMGIEARDPKLDAAQQRVDGILSNVLDFCKTSGIDNKHIQTDYVYLQPFYDYKDDNMTLLGYVVRKNITVTLKDLSRFDEFVTGALSLGVNTIHNVLFHTTDLRKYRDEARDMAIKAAKNKAAAMAHALDADIGMVMKINEQNSRWWSTYSSGWGSSGWNRGMSQNVVQNADTEAPPVKTIAPGQIAVDASVTVTFALKRQE